MTAATGRATTRECRTCGEEFSLLSRHGTINSPPAPSRDDRPDRENAARARITPLAYTRDEAAAALGISRDTLERHVLPDVRSIRLGDGPRAKQLIPVKELEKWIERQAARWL